MEIRRIGLTEANLVFELFDKYRQFYNQPSDIILAETFINQRLSNNESVIFVATEGGAPVGFTQLYPKYSSMRASKNWILNDLYVESTHRKTGTGRALIEKAMEFAKGHGATFVQLETAVDNYAAQRLYEAIGFIEQEPETEFLLYKVNI
ncbi:MAG TPA: GNAT family N-acetyltransferase [Mucilaginibacter sp.]|jgi:ribosomal protein S18 acetylase RimI-like enzyme|nr:GNAT family N-acetyltransferase [Mucilaginibacter sp.]